MSRLAELTQVAFGAAVDAMGEDCKAAILRGQSGQMPRGLLVITFEANGAYRICGDGVPVHEAIGILQRCCIAMHNDVDRNALGLIKIDPSDAPSAAPPAAVSLPQKSE